MFQTPKVRSSKKTTQPHTTSNGEDVVMADNDELQPQDQDTTVDQNGEKQPYKSKALEDIFSDTSDARIRFTEDERGTFFFHIL